MRMSLEIETDFIPMYVMDIFHNGVCIIIMVFIITTTTTVLPLQYYKHEVFQIPL